MQYFLSFTNAQSVSIETGCLVQADIPGAILHYTYGAQGNDTVSEMALGFRHMFGFGVPKNCPTAVSYYNAVAEKVIIVANIFHLRLGLDQRLAFPCDY